MYEHSNDYPRSENWAANRKREESRKRKRSSFTLLPEESEILKNEIVPQSGSQNISNLLSLIAKGELKIVRSEHLSDCEDEIDNLAIKNRILSLLDEPIAAFWASVAFTEQFSRLLGLNVEQDDIGRISPETEKIIEQLLLRALGVVFCAGYTMPDRHINNMSAFINWACFPVALGWAEDAKLISLKSYSTKQISDEALNELLGKEKVKEIDRCVETIWLSIDRLRTSASGDGFVYLKQKMLDGLTLSQMQYMLSLQGQKVEKKNLKKEIKIALSKFQERMRNQYKYDDAESREKRIKNISILEKSKIETTKRFCKLILIPKNQNSLNYITQKIEHILLCTSEDPFLDFLISESLVYLFKPKEKYSHMVQKVSSKLDEEINFLQESFDERFILDNNKEAIEEYLKWKIRYYIHYDIDINVLKHGNHWYCGKDNCDRMHK